jgi:hypothetical protein
MDRYCHSRLSITSWAAKYEYPYRHQWMVSKFHVPPERNQTEVWLSAIRHWELAAGDVLNPG